MMTKALLSTCILAGLAHGGLISCSNDLQRTSEAANNHIMLVDPAMPSFGATRLQALARGYPGLGSFLRQEGWPRYLAETQKKNLHYMVLYYPQHRSASVWRADPAHRFSLEHSGVYPITTREMSVLGKLEAGLEAGGAAQAQ